MTESSDLPLFIQLLSPLLHEPDGLHLTVVVHQLILRCSDCLKNGLLIQLVVLKWLQMYVHTDIKCTSRTRAS